MVTIINQIQTLGKIQEKLKEYIKTKSNVKNPVIFCDSFLSCYTFNHATETDIRYLKYLGKTKEVFVDYTMFEVDKDLYQVTIDIEEELINNERIKVTCKIANIRKI